MVPSPCVACRKSEAGIKRKIQACDEELRIGFVEVHISVSGNDKSQRKIRRKIRGPKVVAPNVFSLQKSSVGGRFSELAEGWALLFRRCTGMSTVWVRHSGFKHIRSKMRRNI